MILIYRTSLQISIYQSIDPILKDLIGKMSSEEAIVYAALILADDGVEITAEKLQALTKAAGVEVEPVWANLFAKALEGKNINDLLMNIGTPGAGGAPAAGGGAAGGGGAAEEKKEEEKPKEEEKEESDEDMGFGLFD